MKIALITGASSGLGAELARLIAEEPELDELWLAARRTDRLAEVGKSLPGTHTLRLLSLDLTDESSIAALEEQLKEEQPEIRWLVNAAGFGKMGTNEEIGRKDCDSMLLLNDKAAMDITQIALPYLKKGSIVMEICSTAAFQPLGGLGVYAATKAFLLSYSRSLHYELLPRGIRVTAVCPYWIRDTEFIPVSRQTKNSTAVKHFPLASKKKSVAAWAMRDAKLGLSVSTPGIVCSAHRLVTKFVPRDVMMAVWAGIRRI